MNMNNPETPPGRIRRTIQPPRSIDQGQRNIPNHPVQMAGANQDPPVERRLIFAGPGVETDSESEEEELELSDYETEAGSDNENNDNLPPPPPPIAPLLIV